MPSGGAGIAAAEVGIDPARRACLPRAAGRTSSGCAASVDRLLLYALGQTVITLDDVREIAGPAALQDDWAMTNAIEQRNAADALGSSR